MMQYFLTPSQIAKECNTTKRTVLFYNEKNILIPKIVDEKGFRGYSKRQINNLKLLLLLQISNISINEISDYLEQTNFAYSKLYKKFANTIKENNKKLNQYEIDISQDYTNKFSTISKHEFKTTHEINYYSLSTYTKLEDSFQILDRIDTYFTNTPHTPTYLIKFIAKSRIEDEQMISIGIAKEAKLKPKEKYQHLFELTNEPPHKSYSRVFLMKKNNQIEYIHSLYKHMLANDYRSKTAILILHNKEYECDQYICESNILL